MFSPFGLFLKHMPTYRCHPKACQFVSYKRFSGCTLYAMQAGFSCFSGYDFLVVAIVAKVHL
jgi:hypothetical protein